MTGRWSAFGDTALFWVWVLAALSSLALFRCLERYRTADACVSDIMCAVGYGLEFEACSPVHCNASLSPIPPAFFVLCSVLLHKAQRNTSACAPTHFTYKEIPAYIYSSQASVDPLIKSTLLHLTRNSFLRISTMPTESEMRSRRDSWPPTQMRLKPTLSTKNRPLPSFDDIDDDPLTYFLTPAPLLDDDDMDDVLLDFDAGIEDASSPRPFVRSVSPSTLDGLRKPGLRPMSPDTSSEISESNNEDDYDDDDEDYVSFSPSKHGGLLSLRDLFANSRPPVRPKSPAFNQSTNNSLLSPTALSSSPKLRGRSRGRGRHGASSRGHSATRRPGQLWREPSPDVWSIEEETEEEMMSEVGSSVGARSDTSDDEAESKRRKGKKAKSNKKVRFVLPAQEV